MDFDQTAAGLGEGGSTFHGSYTRSVDTKGRFNLPFRFRQSGPGPAEEKYVVSRGADGSLSLLPYSIWIANFNRLRQGTPGKDLRGNLRRMSLASKTVEPDAQGRVAIPPEILAANGIGKRITVVGMGSYMELWSPEALAQLEAGLEDPDAGFLDEFYR